jgi:hypothetical protein
MDTPRTPEAIFQEMGEIRTIERGRLCEMHHPSGRTYHNLQFWSEGRNRCEYVRARDVEAVREAVEGYGRFRELADEYACAVEARTRRERDGLEPSAKKGLSARRPQPPPSGN